MSLRTELKAFEEGLSITSPFPLTAQAFLSAPDRDIALGNRRAVFENFPHAAREVGQLGEFQEHFETVRVRFTAYDADFDKAIEIADAFKAVFLNAMAYQRVAGRRLNSTFDYVIMRDEPNQVFESFDGRPGWEMFLDFEVFRTVVAP